MRNKRAWITACSCVLIACGSTAGTGTDGPPVAIDGPPGDDGRTFDAAPGPGMITVAHQFDGDSGPGLEACQTLLHHCSFPEPNVAANGTQVVQVTWQHINVYDYSGTLLSSTPMSTFITNAGLSAGNPIEPHVLYDEFIGRWLVTTTCVNDCLLVSAGSDATGAWQGIYVGGPQADPGMHLGYDKNGVYVSEFTTGDHDAITAGYSYNLFAIPSAEVQWTGTFAPTHRNRGHNTPLDAVPVIDHDMGKLPTDPAFFVAKTCPSTSCQYGSNFAFEWLINTVTWTGTTATYGPDQLVSTDIGSTQNKWLYNTPRASGAIAQAGSAVQVRVMESHRLLDAIQHAGHINVVLPTGPCTTGCNSQGSDTRNILLWADIDCSTPTACVVSQTAKIASATDDYAFASLGVDLHGNVGIAAAAMSDTLAPSIVAWGRRAGDAPSTLFGPTTVTAGTQPITCINDPVAFGNAVGISTVRDPLDGTKLWTTQQYGSSGTACVWNTRIVQYQVH